MIETKSSCCSSKVQDESQKVHAAVQKFQAAAQKIHAAAQKFKLKNSCCYKQISKSLTSSLCKCWALQAFNDL